MQGRKRSGRPDTPGITAEHLCRRYVACLPLIMLKSIFFSYMLNLNLMKNEKVQKKTVQKRSPRRKTVHVQNEPRRDEAVESDVVDSNPNQLKLF